MLRYCLLTLILFINLFIKARETDTNSISQHYYIHTYTTNDGLSQVSINDIVQDEQGFLWIATQSGLNRFDGTNFHTFEAGDYGKNSCGNYINVLLAEKNNIWMGTRASGLCCYNQTKHSFYNISALNNFTIEDMAMDSLHHLYVTVENKGVAVITITDDQYQVDFINYFKNKNITATALYLSRSKILWVGTKEGRLFYGKPNHSGKILFNEFDFSGKPEKIFVINSNNPGQLWVGTQNNLYRINLISNKQHKVTFANQEISSVVYEIKWKGDILWIGTGTGLLEYDTKHKQLLNRYLHSRQDLTTLSNDVIYSVLTDNNQQIWVGTGKYLNLFYKDDIFKKIKNFKKQKGSLNSNVIFSILKSGNDLWIGTSGGGINLLRKGESSFFTKKSHHLPSDICFSLIKHKNAIWAGTKEGLVIINNQNQDTRSMKVKTVLHDDNDKNSLSCNFIRNIYKDNNNTIWLCTSGGGLERFTGDLSTNSFRFTHYKHNPFNSNTIASDRVNYIIQTDSNQYWIATDKGLSIMKYNDNKPESIEFTRLKIADTVLLSKEVIYTLLKDNDGEIWIGTTGGLYSFYNRKLNYYNQQNGLPDNVIYAILEDLKGDIWVSTNKGLSRFNKKTKTFTNYHKPEGLSSEEYDLHAKFIDTNGILYFGGINGITFFNPEKLIDKKTNSKLYINNLQFVNPENNTVQTLYIKNNQPVSLKQKQFPVTINFSNINLKYFKNTIFAYRLLPGNPRWNILKEKRFIQLLNLSPGDYTLEISEAPKGIFTKNNNLIRIPLTVKPLWWQSQWAYTGYMLIFLILLYFYLHFSLKRKMVKQENLRLIELDNLKSRLYANITHEFRTPLTVIKGITAELTEEAEKNGKKQFNNKLAMIERNSNKLLHLVKQMLDMSKVEEGKMKPHLIQDNIVGYLQYILESFQSMADGKNIQLVFYHETDKIIMDFDRDKMLVIVSNLLSNAIKFTPSGGKVIFHVKRQTTSHSDVLIMKVQDSGIGIKTEHLQHIFNRFYQVDNSSTRKGEGTGIGLALTKELVELLDGSINVKSIAGELTEFCVTIPITNKAVKEPSKPVFITSSSNNKTIENNTKSHNNKNLPLALVIEDNSDVAQYIISSIGSKYRIKWSPDGGTGIEAAINIIPDIIISDVMMPVKDGFEVCKTLKQNERTSHIPIILLTAKATDNDRIEGLSHGADAYLTKPFNKQELFIRLEQLIKIRKKLQEKYGKTDVNIIQKNKLTLEERFLKKAIEFIKNHIDNPKLNAELLATQLGMSESQLYRKLKALGRKSTALFIRSIRLSVAKEMLETTNCNVSEAAYGCGFNDPAWFSRAFKKEYGISPGSLK